MLENPIKISYSFSPFPISVPSLGSGERQKTPAHVRFAAHRCTNQNPNQNQQLPISGKGSRADSPGRGSCLPINLLRAVRSTPTIHRLLLCIVRSGSSKAPPPANRRYGLAMEVQAGPYSETRQIRNHKPVRRIRSKLVLMIMDYGSGGCIAIYYSAQTAQSQIRIRNLGPCT